MGSNITRKKKQVSSAQKKRNKYINDYKKVIVEHSQDLWTPKHDIQPMYIKTNSWFDIKKYNNESVLIKENNLHIEEEFDDGMMRCVKVDLDLYQQTRKNYEALV